jgi:hypothetical protein
MVTGVTIRTALLFTSRDSVEKSLQPGLTYQPWVPGPPLNGPLILDLIQPP